jgi:ammonia channel protein AmtB
MYEPFMIQRGLIAGVIAISISPSNYKTWTACLNGFLGGVTYVVACKIMHVLDNDDTLHITQTYGAPAFYSLFSIVLFHKDEGFFFKDVYFNMLGATDSDYETDENLSESVIKNARAKIIVLLGSNFLGILTVTIAAVVIILLANKFIIEPMIGLRITKESEIIG